MNPNNIASPTSLRLERTHDGAVARLVLAAGRGNVITGRVMREIQAALGEIADDSAVKLIVLTGEGKHFSFGASVEEHRQEQAAEMIRGFHELILSIARCDVPMLTCVSGMCLGGALEVALAGHLIFADVTAAFGQPEITLGVFAPPASVLLPLRIGQARAEELLITGDVVGAPRALELGLIQKVFDSTDAMNAGVEEWIGRNIIPKSASSLRMAVRAGRMRMIDILEEELPRLERFYVDVLMQTHDASEGIAAFLEKRPAVWRNA